MIIVDQDTQVKGSHRLKTKQNFVLGKFINGVYLFVCLFIDVDYLLSHFKCPPIQILINHTVSSGFNFRIYKKVQSLEYVKS